jgi:hypothetical protein
MDSTLEYMLSNARGFLLLHPPLPEAWSGRCLSAAGSPRAHLTRGPGVYPMSSEEAGGVDRW